MLADSIFTEFLQIGKEVITAYIPRYRNQGGGKMVILFLLASVAVPDLESVLSSSLFRVTYFFKSQDDNKT